MAQLDLFFNQLLKFEGGFVNNPAHPCGATNKGITLQTFTSFARSLLGVDPTLRNLRALTGAQALKIYKARYWDALHGDEIPDQLLADIFFELFVNAGNNAIRLMQRLLNETGGTSALTLDGIYGSGLLRALLAAEPVALYRRYKAERRAYYQDLAVRRPPSGADTVSQRLAQPGGQFSRSLAGPAPMAPRFLLRHPSNNTDTRDVMGGDGGGQRAQFRQVVCPARYRISHVFNWWLGHHIGPGFLLCTRS